MATMQAETFEGLKGVFKNGRTRKKIGNNTIAIDRGDHVQIVFHGSMIAKVEKDRVWFNLCGYPSVTTRERINHFVRGGYVHQKNYVQMYSTSHFNEDGAKMIPITTNEWHCTTDFE